MLKTKSEAVQRVSSPGVSEPELDRSAVSAERNTAWFGSAEWYTACKGHVILL